MASVQLQGPPRKLLHSLTLYRLSWLALMPLTMSQDYKAIQEKLREITEY